MCCKILHSYRSYHLHAPHVLLLETPDIACRRVRNDVRSRQISSPVTVCDVMMVDRVD